MGQSTHSAEIMAAEYEARQAIRDMWRYGFPRCGLTRYAGTAGALADRLNPRAPTVDELMALMNL